MLLGLLLSTQDSYYSCSEMGCKQYLFLLLCFSGDKLSDRLSTILSPFAVKSGINHIFLHVVSSPIEERQLHHVL